MSGFKVGDEIVCVKRADGNWYAVGDVHVVSSEPFKAFCNDEGVHYTAYNVQSFKDKNIWVDERDYELVKEDVTENYAAAFNAWMNDYTNCPQDYEDSHTTAIRHLTEKLNGEVPSYGAVCCFRNI